MKFSLIALCMLSLIFIVLWILEKKHNKKWESDFNQLKDKYACIDDAENEATKRIAEASSKADEIIRTAKNTEQAAQAFADATRSTAENILSQANAAATEIETSARQKANEIEVLAQQKASEVDIKAAETDAAVQLARNQEQQSKEKRFEYEQAIKAMKHIMEGYGDEWLKPAYSLLDDLAEEFSFTDAGAKLKEARQFSANLVRNGKAADCDYAESYRRTTAMQFVLDAFNGKVDSILSKVKAENYGILERKIMDAYQLVNKNGEAFRNAHILPQYLDARLAELRWASIVQELKKQSAEEQRALREQMREEEKARKEYERAQKEAAREEATLQKAMEKAQAMLASATEQQKEKYEAEIAQLEQQLQDAKDKNQRALSMAQQTKHGTVYVISNVGSFGENIYKVGMTRRLNPMDRVKELGDASVPFPFDVHAFIESDDAPALETTLHHELALMQINKVNPRKEFFQVNISTIKNLVDKHGYQANWTMEAKATEYRESRAIYKKILEDPSEKIKWEAFMR